MDPKTQYNLPAKVEPEPAQLTEEEFKLLTVDEQLAYRCGKDNKLHCFPHEIEALRKLGCSEEAIAKYCRPRAHMNRHERRAAQAKRKVGQAPPIR